MPKKAQPKYPIDLAKTPESLGMPTPTKGESDNTPIYPSLYLEWEKPYGFPDEGTMTVRFKKRSEETRKHEDGMTQRVELDIMEILDTEGKETPEAEEEDSGDVLDKEVKKVTVKKSKKVTATGSGNGSEDEESY